MTNQSETIEFAYTADVARRAVDASIAGGALGWHAGMTFLLLFGGWLTAVGLYAWFAGFLLGYAAMYFQALYSTRRRFLRRMERS